MKKYILLLAFSTCITLINYGQASPTQDSAKIKSNSVTENVDGKIETKVDKEADLAKGESAWNKFLKKNVDFDAPIFNGAPRGIYTVKVSFVVYTDGHIGDFKALTRHGYGMEHALIRALKKSPLWTPATKDGQLVNSLKIQTITFVVEEL